MPKKGKGKKGKGKDDSTGGNAGQAGGQAGSSQESGKGRGRGVYEPPHRRVSQPGETQKKDVTAADPCKGRGEPSVRRGETSAGSETSEPSVERSEPVTSAFEESKVPKGRGRGRGVPPPRSPSEVPGIQHENIPKEVELPKKIVPTEKISSQITSTKKKQEVQDPESLQLAGLSLDFEAPIKHRPFAARPNHAMINDRNRIKLLVNYFKLEYKVVSIYHYDIDISDSTKENKKGKSLMAEGRTAKEDIKKNVKHVEREKRRNMGKGKCRRIISEIFRSDGVLKKFCPVYDGQKNLFTSQALPCTESKTYPVKIEMEGKEKNFFVTIKPVEKKDGSNIISLEPLLKLYSKRACEIPNEVLLVYETVMSHREPMYGTGQREPPFEQVQFRNSFFSLKDRKNPLGCGLEVWFGYHQAVQLAEVGPVVVINLAAKAFHKSGPVISYANDVLGGKDITTQPKLQQWEVQKLSDALRGIQVKVTHQKIPRKYKIKAVVPKSAKEQSMDINNKKVTVAEYFQTKYQKKLLYPYLPLLQMQTTTNTTFIPIETCEVTEGQPKIGKLSPDLTAKMIKDTAVPPQSRKEDVSWHASHASDRSKKYMKEFGLLMDLKLMNVDGRIIAAPQLSYFGGPNDTSRIAKPDIKGVWRIEDGKKFYRIVKIQKWVLISFADERRCGQDMLSKYCQYLVSSARKCGIQLDRPQSIDIFGRNVSAENAIQRAKKSGAQLAVVVLNRRDDYHSYDEVKFLADFKYNLVTQCMEDKTLFRINDQITTNVCLKINVKLGGINHVLLQNPSVFKEPVIVLGIDAIHWPRGFGYPSILSIVGSLNPTASRYALVCDLQKNERKGKISQEIIRDMKKIVKEVLQVFSNTNNRYPNKIIVFRDGVSEGQFQHALDYEVSGIQQACKELFNNIIPITFLVVQKRHQTRFFPENPRQGVGRNQNVPPGTCVDQKITHPVFFDYFICSHEGIQGTSKPAKYTVLHDDIGFKCEELQQLCYFLCHTYVRCTRSVSLPAPVMYADLAAARAKKYADLFTASDGMSVVSEDEQKDLPPNVVEAIKSMKSFENNMFYV